MWHIDAEVISLLFLLVIIFDVFQTTASISLKDNLFTALTITTACAILVDIVSSAAMIDYQNASWWLIQGSMLLYLILTPLLPMLWQMYAIALLKMTSKKRTLTFTYTTLPFIVYAVLVLTNPFTGWMFELTSANEYTRGILFSAVFVIFYGYSLGTLALALVSRKKLERATCIVLAIFPLITGTGVYFQQIFSGYLVTGAAFTLVILITYLFIQNRKATRDSLTGIYNRAAFSTAIEKIERGNRHGFVLAVAIDDFKLLNRKFGQKNGDLFLKQIADFLIYISPDKTAYRYGGDIFTLVIKNATEDEVLEIAAAITRRFNQPFYLKSVGYSASASVGIVGYPQKSQEDAYSLISALDFAVYQAKKQGRGLTAFFSEDLVKQLKRHHDVTEAITQALKNRTFEVHLQPIFHLQTNKFSSAEALLRLTDEHLGRLSPTEFIPIAEETGQIVEITYIVLEDVCKFLKENRSILHDEVSIAVNFSVIQFMQNDMVKRVVTIIDRYDIPHHLIKIEITESVVAESFDEIKSAMKQLCNYGIQFAMDDYGQGYSNISYLINLPFTYIKLDKSIIDEVESDEKYIRALVPMFKSLNKIIVAEGVETKEQAAILLNLDCENIQGFYFAKPLPQLCALEVFKEYTPWQPKTEQLKTTTKTIVTATNPPATCTSE